MNILISACLLGVNCRYDVTGKVLPEIEELMGRCHLIPVCPEIYGGMATPRDPSEIQGERVANCLGEDVTEFFLRGAQEVVRLAELYGCKCAVLKERSPSCGFGQVYDGGFTGRLIAGNGIAAQRLFDRGLEIFGENRIDDLIAYIDNEK